MLSSIEALQDESDVSALLDHLSRQDEKIQEALDFTRTRRQTATASRDAAQRKYDDSQSDLNLDSMAAERAAGSEDVSPDAVDVSRVETGVDQQDRQLTQQFGRA